MAVVPFGALPLGTSTEVFNFGGGVPEMTRREAPVRRKAFLLLTHPDGHHADTGNILKVLEVSVRSGKPFRTAWLAIQRSCILNEWPRPLFVSAAASLPNMDPLFSSINNSGLF